MLSRLWLLVLACFFVVVARGQVEGWAEQRLKESFIGAAPVVAILDNGFNLEHPCLEGVWSSGGYDFVRDTSEIVSRSHGTAMAGVIAAECEDGLVEGVAKGAKCLPLVVDGGRKSVLEALRYVKQQKRLYVESGGASGSNVSVVNISLGLAGDVVVKELDSCIDSLGQLNVLTIVATVVDGADVWNECTSDYLLRVHVVLDTTACVSGSVCFKDEPLLALTKNGVAMQGGVSLFTAYVAGLAILSRKLSVEKPYDALVVKRGLLSSSGLFALQSFYNYLKSVETFD